MFGQIPEIQPSLPLQRTFPDYKDTPSALAHSQIVATRQPFPSKAERCLRSRSLFKVIFSLQNSRLVPGHLKRWQSWPCQKQPCTKITALYFGNTRSGLPGRSLQYRRNRKPRRCRADRMASSGAVFVPRIPAIIRLRTSGFTMSAATGQIRPQPPRDATSGMALPSAAECPVMCGFISWATARTTGTTTALPNWR